jgi:hypothetical protein
MLLFRWTKLHELQNKIPINIASQNYPAIIAIAWMKCNYEITKTYPTPLAIQPFRRLPIANYPFANLCSRYACQFNARTTNRYMMPPIIPFHLIISPPVPTGTQLSTSFFPTRLT